MEQENTEPVEAEEEIVLTPLQRAIQTAGGQTALARQLTKMTGETYRQSHVWNWITAGQPPANICTEIEEITGESVKLLRPDVFK